MMLELNEIEPEHAPENQFVNALIAKKVRLSGRLTSQPRFELSCRSESLLRLISGTFPNATTRFISPRRKMHLGTVLRMS